MTREGIFLGHLEAFLEVARLGNVTRAADSLFLTQPALTARLGRLEQEVGAHLLIRDRRGARLTEAGRAFLPFAEQAMAAIGEGQQTLRRYTDVGAAELALGATPALSTHVLPRVIKRMLQNHPQASLTVHTAVSEDLLPLLLDREIQLALSRALHHPDTESVPLYEEEYVLVVDPAHPLATRERVHARDLTDETLVLFNRSASYRDFAQNLLHQAGAVPRTIVDVDNSEASKKMVREGIGITLLPRTAVAAELHGGTLNEVQVADINPIHRSMVALRRHDTPESPLVLPLLRFLRSRLGQMGLRQGHSPARG